MRVLGIDIGTTRIKAVEVENAFRSLHVIDYHEHIISPGIDDPFLTVARLMGNLPHQPQKIALAIPTRFVTSRAVEIPTSDRKAIQAAAQFEIEDEMPFDSDTVMPVWAHKASPNKSTKIFLQAAQKKNLSEFFDRLRMAGVNPQLVTTETWAFRTLIMEALTSDAESHHVNFKKDAVLLVNIGHSHTGFHVFFDGFPVVDRSIQWGGRNLTTIISEKYSIPWDQAEQAKLSQGFILTESQKETASREQVHFSELLQQESLDLIWELRKIEFTFKSLTKRNIHGIYLTGGASQLPGLAHVIQDSLNIPVLPFHGMSSLSAAGVKYSQQAESSFSLSTALATCLLSKFRAPKMNFLRGEFLRRSSTQTFDFQSLKEPLLLFGSVLFALLFSLSIQRFVYQKQLAETDERLKKSIKSAFPTLGAAAAAKLATDPKKLKAEVDRRLAMQNELASLFQPDSRSPLETLNRISQSIERDLAVDVISYQAGAVDSAKGNAPKVFQITALVGSPQLAERFSQSLKAKFRKIELGPVSEEPGTGTAPRFRFSVKGEIGD